MKFQSILLSVFGIIAVIAVIVFAKSPAKSSDTDPSLNGPFTNIEIWGTFQGNTKLPAIIQEFNKKYQKSFNINYVYHDPVTFDHDIVEALASGKGPDVLLLPDDLILRHTDKIEQMVFTPAYTALTFQSTFIQAAEIYMRDKGVVAVPFAVDPMVMYWNRDLFDNASITEPPKNWSDFLAIAPKLTKRDPKTYAITQSAISFGEYANVMNAKEIIAMLFLQVGNPIVGMSGNTPKSFIFSQGNDQLVPDADVVSAFRYFMDFSNPLKNIYSWSRAMPNSRDAFINGSLAVYFDYASAYNEIKAKNPHLNFMVAPVPQPTGTKTEVTFARMHGFTVLKSSKNKSTAFIVLQKLLDPHFAEAFSGAFNLPPVRRDLLAVPQTDAVNSVLYDAAIRARTWLDPRPDETDKAFQESVESVSSGRETIESSLDGLNNAFKSLLVAYE
jgi:multiple sugar transport system substrate-binding protein